MPTAPSVDPHRGSAADENRRLAEALRASESFLESFIERLNIHVFRKDVEGRYTYVNRRFCARRGKTPEEVLGKTSADFVTPEQARKYRQDDLRMMETGQVFETIEEESKPDGEMSYIHVIKVPLYDNEGRCVGTQGMYWDVTAQKQAEEKLKEAQRKLLETSRLAGMAEIASGVLHNIGNVLNSVNVSASMMASDVSKLRFDRLETVVSMLREHEADLAQFLTTDAKGQKLRLYLDSLHSELQAKREKIATEINQLRGHIDHINEIVRMQQDLATAPAQPERTTLTLLLEDALSLTGSCIEENEVTLVRDYQADPALMVPRHKVLQVLVNLLNNAAHACRARAEGRTVTLRTRIEGDWVQTLVIDNGMGIAPDNLARLFTFGFTTKKNGHGFGLHNAALIARELHGNLRVASEGPGTGATFILELPKA